MIAGLNAIGALVMRELHRHMLAALGGAFLLGVALAKAYDWELAREGASLVRATVRFALVVLPIVPLIAVRRMVVLERQSDGYAFLAALPVRPSAILGVKWALSLAVTLLTGLVTLAIGAGLGDRYEIVDRTHTLHLAWRIAAYLFAWHGLAFGVAHFGRYRFRAWFAVACLALCAGAANDVWFSVLWDASIALDDPPPYRALPIALAWGLAGNAVALVLGLVRGGTFVDWAYRPVPMWRVIPALTALGAMIAAAQTIVIANTPVPPGYDFIPDVRADGEHVRASGRAHDIGLALSEDVQHVRERFPDCASGTIVVVPAHPVRAVVTRLRSDPGTFAFAIDPDRPAAARRGVLRAILEGCPSEHPRGVDALARAGAAALFVDDPDDRVHLERRAAYAARLGIGPDDLADLPLLERRLGPDVFEGVAWLGLVTRGDDAGVAEDAPYDEASRARWATALTDAYVRHPEVAAYPVLNGQIERLSTPLSATVLRWSWGGPIVPQGVTLRWTPLAAMREVPDDWRLDGIEPVDRPDDEVPVPLDEGEPLAAAFVVHVPELDGDVWSPWVLR